MPNQPDYYASTAYDSTHKRVLPPLNRDKMNRAERFVRKFPLKTRGCHCNECITSTTHIMDVFNLKDLTSSDYHEVLLNSSVHEMIAWGTYKNKRILVDSLVFIAWWFWFFGGFFMIFLGLIDVFDLGLLFITTLFVFLPFLLWCLGKLALARDWVKAGNNIEFNRRTGMVTFPWEKGRATVPFDEFDPYLSNYVTYAATQKQFLRLVHRYSNKHIVTQIYYGRHWQLQIAWEETQRFMDISQPLADIPLYDFTRINDPVSANYDKKHHRPKDYWKNLDIEKVEEMTTASRNACEKFPWGKTREQAIHEGWQLSGVGEGDWQTHQKDDAA